MHLIRILVVVPLTALALLATAATAKAGGCDTSSCTGGSPAITTSLESIGMADESETVNSPCRYVNGNLVDPKTGGACARPYRETKKSRCISYKGAFVDPKTGGACARPYWEHTGKLGSRHSRHRGGRRATTMGHKTSLGFRP